MYEALPDFTRTHTHTHSALLQSIRCKGFFRKPGKPGKSSLKPKLQFSNKHLDKNHTWWNNSLWADEVKRYLPVTAELFNTDWRLISCSLSSSVLNALFRVGTEMFAVFFLQEFDSDFLSFWAVGRSAASGLKVLAQWEQLGKGNSYTEQSVEQNVNAQIFKFLSPGFSVNRGPDSVVIFDSSQALQAGKRWKYESTTYRRVWLVPF